MKHRPTVVRGDVRDLDCPSVVTAIGRLASARPHRLAVQGPGTGLTFAGLWERSGALAHALLDSGVRAGDRVALWAARTPDTVAAALAALRVRAAFVPLDPGYPAERLRAIADGAAPELLVYPQGAQGRPVSLPELPVVDTADIPARAGAGSALPCEEPRPDDPAYVIFTSGSTGAPKGVVIGHGSLMNYSAWCAAVIGARGGGTPLFGSLGFDHSFTSLWPTLLRGEPVVVCEGAWDHGTLFGPRESPFSLVKVTPSQLRFFERTAAPAYASVTRVLMSGGEPLDTELVAGLAARLGGIRLINHYGPTETTIGCCAHEFDTRSIPRHPTVPIGTPIWNTRAYLVDESLDPVAAGRPAELVIAGAGVMRGYLGAAAGGDRLVDEAALGGPPGAAYRTGDLVELLEDGTLLHLGRSDDQVKVSGYRVELGALRALALAVDGVADVAFDIVPGLTQSIEAFVVPRSGAPAETLADRVRTALAGSLPRAVAPRRVHLVAEIAVTPHGKRDLRETRRRWQAASPSGSGARP